MTATLATHTTRRRGRDYTASDERLIALLRAHPDGLTISQLAGRHGSSYGHIEHALLRLARRGLCICENEFKIYLFDWENVP